jgi:hypothetical protein
VAASGAGAIISSSPQHISSMDTLPVFGCREAFVVLVDMQGNERRLSFAEANGAQVGRNGRGVISLTVQHEAGITLYGFREAYLVLINAQAIPFKFNFASPR